MIYNVKIILKRILSFRLYEFIREEYWKVKKWNPIKKIKRYVLLAIFYPTIYWCYSRRTIDENKILFIEPEYDKLSNNFSVLYTKLISDYDFKIHIHLLHDLSKTKTEFYKRCVNLIRDIATAKYVFMDLGSNVLGRLSFRKETQIIQLWHACGAFKKFGFSTAELIFGGTKKELESYPVYKYCTLVTVSSPDIIWAYAEAMGIDNSHIKSLGVSRTDVFFTKTFQKSARQKFEFFMPESKNKKVILFAPTFRGRVAKAKTSQAFSIPLFFDALSKEYILIIKHHPLVKELPIIPEKYHKFAADFTNVMDIEELLCVADICITDYSSLIFEYSLFEKPMIFFAYDLEEYFDWRGFYYDYDELTPGPVFKTNFEMIDYIRHIDERFEKQKVIDFRKKFMSSCDGHSTERIMNYVFGTDLDKHRKSSLVQGTSTNTACCKKKYEAQETILYKAETDSEPIKNRLLELYPKMKGKKIIAYFVKFREATGYPQCDPYIDWQLFYEYLNGKYGVLYCENRELTNKLNIPSYYSDMFISCGDILTEQEMLQAADIVIADFREDILTYSMDKPFLIHIPDYRWYCSNIEDYENSIRNLMECGCMKESTYDLISAIRTEEFGMPYKNWADEYRGICEHFHRIAQSIQGGLYEYSDYSCRRKRPAHEPGDTKAVYQHQ